MEAYTTPFLTTKTPGRWPTWRHTPRPSLPLKHPAVVLHGDIYNAVPYRENIRTLSCMKSLDWFGFWAASNVALALWSHTLAWSLAIVVASWSVRLVFWSLSLSGLVAWWFGRLVFWSPVCRWCGRLVVWSLGVLVGCLSMAWSPGGLVAWCSGRLSVGGLVAWWFGRVPGARHSSGWWF